MTQYRLIRQFRLLLPAAALLMVGSGCQSWFHSEVPPMTLPAAQIRVDHFVGTALSGPQPVALNTAAVESAWGVTARVIAIQSSTPAGFARVGPAARLVLGPDTGAVVSPSARLIYSTLFRSLGTVEDLDASLGPATDRSALDWLTAGMAQGATASLEIRLPQATPQTAAFSRRAIHLQLYRHAVGDAYDVAVISDDLTTPTADATSAEARELIVLERKLVDGVDRFAVAIPMKFPASTASAIVVDFSIDGRPGAGQSVAAPMAAQLDASVAALVAMRSSMVPTPEELAIARSLETLGSAGASPRGTLSFLADRTGAKLAQTVFLVADDRTLELIAGDVRARMTQMSSHDARSIAWLLDRATIESLSSIKEEDAARVLPPILGALSIYAGEAGRHLDVLRSLAGESTSSEDLYNRIVAEHVILLEESSPGLRVRAYDFLKAADRAPEGFNPLGTPQERRAALERSRETVAASQLAATQPTTRP